MTIETDVMRGIIRAGVDAVMPHNFPIQTPGVVFVPPDDKKYFELVLIQSNSLLANPRNWVGSGMTWGDEKSFSGILRIILHWPIDGRGVYEPTEVLACVKAEIPKGRTIFYEAARLLIYDHPSMTYVLEAGTENLYSLTVPYQCFYAPDPAP